jgi:NAD-dependent dihydropyrimidine dehydrogenase PreA subunit
MAVERIDLDLCNGCGICLDVCPPDVFRMDAEQGKAVIKYPEDCNPMLCALCELNCPTQAIYVTPGMHPLALSNQGL